MLRRIPPLVILPLLLLLAAGCAPTAPERASQPRAAADPLDTGVPRSTINSGY